jgi:hypothetical protein
MGRPRKPVNRAQTSKARYTLEAKSAMPSARNCSLAGGKRPARWRVYRNLSK